MSGPCQSVIVLNDFCYVQGGASKVAIDEAVALRSFGLDVTFLAAVGDPCQPLRDAGVRVVSLGQPELLDALRHPGAAVRAMWNPAAFAAMRNLLGQHDPRRTVVHLHGYTKALSTSPALAARDAGFPTVCTLHDFFAACPNGAFYDYRLQAPCTLPALSAACVFTNCDKRHALQKAYRVLRGLAQRHVARFPACVTDFITLSRRSAELLRQYLPPQAILHPLSNMIDVPCESAVDVAANRPLVVVGRLEAEKGVDLAAAAASQAGMPIIFAGDGPLRQKVEATGAKVTGWLDQRAVWQVLGESRCLVFPSRWYEAFGLVVAEAAARGVPAIVSDISAAAERVEEGVTGWIYQSGDLGQLVDRMRAVRDDATVRAAGLATYNCFWASPPNRRSHVRELQGIYNEMLVRSGAGSEPDEVFAG
ncbi:MAG: glycosyltransferase [Acetobacteraceae bacterium]|nr:glycosyltransferase [Acetobacteraceae bacterium]